MDFFARQDSARRKTKILALYMALAVIAIVAAINVALFLMYFFFRPGQDGESLLQVYRLWIAKPLWWQMTSLVAWGIVVVSLTRIFFLRGGGETIAKMVRARRIEPDTSDADERKLLNVAEEMAIASGASMPALYVMENENAINAFVAGYQPSESVLVVTAGCLRELNRQELQGVVAHEFSHIFNGDMRLNVHLIGILAGILMIGQVGLFLLRNSFRSSGRSRRGGGGGLAILGIGLILTVIGYIGVFFARLIKAAISRQREFLADAGAVQFTRDPSGIAGALVKIRAHADGSLLDTSHAEEMSHMCIGESVKLPFSRWLASHPPLEQRIQALGQGYLLRVGPRSRRVASTPAPAKQGMPEELLNFATGASAPPLAADSAKLAASVGNFSDQHIAYAAALHRRLPPQLLARIHTGAGAQQFIYALLFNPAVAASQIITQRDGSAALQAIPQFQHWLQALGARTRLPLIDLALPALKSLDAPARQDFLETVKLLIEADRKISVLEYAVQAILHKHLQARPALEVKYKSLGQLTAEIAQVVAMMAQTGKANAQTAENIYGRVMKTFILTPPPYFMFAKPSFSQFSHALAKLARLSPLLKRNIITACADCVVADGVIRPVELELLRAVAEILDCPMPPLVLPERQALGA
jgi:Zn-dependent protease with chaperone function/uncharacterized tellurite resistance protein B-like protein